MPSSDDIQQELDRVLSSTGFARNACVSLFLPFLVDRRLHDKQIELKESVIGVEVFGRRPDFDPKQDSIIRTEAARRIAPVTLASSPRSFCPLAPE